MRRAHLIESVMKTLRQATSGSDDEESRPLINLQRSTSIARSRCSPPASRRRKVNGDLFERLIRMLIGEPGIDCQSGVVDVPVVANSVPDELPTRPRRSFSRRSEGHRVGQDFEQGPHRRSIHGQVSLQPPCGDRHPHIAVFLTTCRGKRHGSNFRLSNELLPAQ